MAADQSDLQSNESRPNADPTWDEAAARAPAVVSYGASVLMTALSTVVAVGIDRGVSIPNLSLVFVVPVIITAVMFGLGQSLCSAILGALAYNFFLTEPRYSLAVDDPANVWAIGLLFVVGLIVSGVAFTSRRRAVEATVLAGQAKVLQGYTRDVVGADDTRAIVQITSRALSALFNVPATVILAGDNGELHRTLGGLELQEADLEAARSALAARAIMRAGIYPNLSSRCDFWPVATSMGHSAVIVLAFDEDERPAAPDMLVDIVASVLSLALDRQAAHPPQGG